MFRKMNFFSETNSHYYVICAGSKARKDDFQFATYVGYDPRRFGPYDMPKASLGVPFDMAMAFVDEDAAKNWFNNHKDVIKRNLADMPNCDPDSLCIRKIVINSEETTSLVL